MADLDRWTDDDDRLELERDSFNGRLTIIRRHVDEIRRLAVADARRTRLGRWLLRRLG